MEIFALICADFQTGKYLVMTPDDPAKPWKEISVSAAIDLYKQLDRYIRDKYLEDNPNR